MSTLHEHVTSARRSFEGAGVPSPEADAVALAAFALGLDAAEVRRRMVLRSEVDGAFVDRYESLVAERTGRVPLQHLTGRAPFRRLLLAVGPGVFVPRPETEVVAGLAIAAARARRPQPVVVDLCTGSGALVLAVKDEVPDAIVHAVEVDPLAHAWAERNVADCGLPVELRLGDARTAFGDLDGSVDVVVSNPPYIPDDQVPLEPEVRDHDPQVALYGGPGNGLGLPLAVAARAAALLRPGGVLVMEHADSQGAALPAALESTGDWEDIADHEDLAGRPRATVAVRTRRT